MRVYLVGGAVRDAALGLPVRERDWVVVGATPEELARAGYMAVGREFPVFLHPESKEEYALARLEKKTGPGYRGFVTAFSPDVTLEDDLARRDLTVNAMARTTEGELVDPHGGLRDLEARVLRHVSPAFVEDPVRVLRVARFAARFAPLGFAVASETLALMRAMVVNGEVAALVAERVWQETARALATERPDVYFEVLRASGALAVVFPEVDALFGVPQPEKWHPEIDAGVHTLMVLRQAALLSPAATVRFAALTHDLGKGKTPRERWPMHHGHEATSVALIDPLCDRLRVPNEHRELAKLAARYHCDAHRAAELRAATILTMLERCDAFRRPERFAELLLACEADARGRLGFEERPYPQAAYLHQCLAAARSVALDETDRAGLDGATIGIRLHELRAQAIAAVKAGAAGPAAQSR
ncbi:MAG TPA: multifunctional CCA addition/repair protein [Steroidobacteraceae bacterium]|nr:multifunctional CCA addition/repair protein [Steroidobacteraceae bacterium]HQW07969.1 multifunctional CCA addition/repair protein [Steroidobacteraceae bacterium]HQX47530.1 multifunctional CCA addition/repair protein [Steroidobacteraceae bacterium]HQX77208.1 multifunctional CCA addition/repair protein [Steroidobacteraceae bacterium]HQZ80645.1 multifunctional CCA addition/repair protein [Steroidobacteraceae bacterium]